MSQDVKINLKPLEKLTKNVTKGLRTTATSGPIRDVLKKWAARYRSFAQLRFDRFSKGGGDWKPLAPSTLRRRRKGKRKNVRKATMLRDTGILFAVLDSTFTNRPGQLEKGIPFGVTVGYGGPHRYPKGRVTIADIASFHQEGGPRLPKRKLIVEPDSKTLAAMANDMTTAFRRFTK